MTKSARRFLWLVAAVVAVVVTHDPGPWFEEALASLAGQDYPTNFTQGVTITITSAGWGRTVTYAP